ncbi:anthrone oxygenase family protein [Pseudonocardia asaccharolytica]|uniref:Membrane protein n=1 Tax=Pseudonocardia asaccharolytica DSM 44247 = NBRC 16224 TaxID=1123024 RepID=A0A511D1Z4_9PSEU|nr:anthrone oxygenase family protein [Pseudonocardia asaccharolytica]GEL18801.1 membrane protein [Pseudonocardia asaccharolytica DSM 44247 = NBRC 16224]
MTLGQALMVVAAVGAGAVGGVFFSFSTFIMRGLARLPAPQGAAAMQSINITAVRPAFMTALFGTGAVCVALAVRAIAVWDAASAPLLVGVGLYLLGAIGVTIVGNVPLNNALAAAEPSGGPTPDLWRDYVRRWTRWNHARTVSCLGAAVAFVVAAIAQS